MNYLSFKQKNKKGKNSQNNQNEVLLKEKSLNTQSLSSKFSKNNMLVAVRTRPLSKSEQEDSNFNTISVPEKDIIKLSMPTEYIPDDMSGIFLAGEQIKILKLKEISYEYDFVFGENSSQEEVYENTTASLIKQVVEGYSATIMAYGATGSGKTYTMVGKGEKVGLMIRAIRDLFNFVKSQKEQDKLYNIKITYIEVYNEILKDLLTDKKTSIEIRSDPNKGVIIQGAECIKVESETEAFKLINSGNKRRTEKQTERNKYSSRSHAVLQIYLEIQEQNKNNLINNYPNFNSEVSFGKLYLVDLAGSERTNANGTNKLLVETGSINKSLLALSKCINLIVTQNKKFIPFRESKLTRILQEPLSGNGRIVLIATLSPAILNFDETLFTLHFANRAKCMKIHMKKNVIENDKEIIEKYEEYIKNLRDEINEVENEIAEQKNNENIKEEENKNDQDEENKENSDKINKIEKEINTHFKNEIDLRKKIIDEEQQIEKLKNDLNGLDYEMIHKPRVNLEYLKNEYDSKKSEIEKIKQKINEEYIKENELISQRRQFKQVINDLNINNAGNFQVVNLFHIYKYYTNLLENMSNEHKKNMNMNEMERKENKISLLNEQLDLRDLFIDNAKQELNKNNIVFKYSDPNLATKEEIELQSYDPFKIKNVINDISNTDIESQNTIDTFNLSKLKNSYLNINERFNEINKINKQLSKSPDIIKEKNNNNKNIFKRNVSTFNKNKILVNAGFNLLNKNNFGNSSNKNFRNLNNSKNMESKYRSFFSNKNTSNNNFGDDSIISRLENEVQKKVKTILKKDFIGRYKRSPYLKIFNE